MDGDSSAEWVVIRRRAFLAWGRRGFFAMTRFVSPAVGASLSRSCTFARRRHPRVAAFRGLGSCTCSAPQVPPPSTLRLRVGWWRQQWRRSRVTFLGGRRRPPLVAAPLKRRVGRGGRAHVCALLAMPGGACGGGCSWRWPRRRLWGGRRPGVGTEHCLTAAPSRRSAIGPPSGGSGTDACVWQHQAGRLALRPVPSSKRHSEGALPVRTTECNSATRSRSTAGARAQANPQVPTWRHPHRVARLETPGQRAIASVHKDPPVDGC